MPVGFSCPNCNGEPAHALHHVADHLEVFYREKGNKDRLRAIAENPKDFPLADALLLSKMVNETPIVELDYYMCTGPTANCVWSLDDKRFFSIDQLIDQMREKDTLKSHAPELFNQVQRATHVSYRNLCDGLRPIMNTRGVFTLDEQALLAPQLMENNEWANTKA